MPLRLPSEPGVLRHSRGACSWTGATSPPRGAGAALRVPRTNRGACGRGASGSGRGAGLERGERTGRSGAFDGLGGRPGARRKEPDVDDEHGGGHRGRRGDQDDDVVVVGVVVDAVDPGRIGGSGVGEGGQPTQPEQEQQDKSDPGAEEGGGGGGEGGGLPPPTASRSNKTRATREPRTFISPACTAPGKDRSS